MKTELLTKFDLTFLCSSFFSSLAFLLQSSLRDLLRTQPSFFGAFRTVGSLDRKET